MKIVKVIHGYPPRYNAGSEVYTQTLCHALADRNVVRVFTREENSFAPDFAVREEQDVDDERVTLHVVNVPRSRDRYRHAGVDQRFADLLDAVAPDVVHVGHLNHLSTSLVREAARREVPIVYTLHDYWVMCPRGQFMQMHPRDESDLWAACDGQEDSKCAERCYARYFSGAEAERTEDVVYWTGWVGRRMRHLRDVVELVDTFVAPARYLYQRYRAEFGLPERKLVYLDYGFDKSRLRGRARHAGEPFTFGYIGTHIPAKGIHHLIEAFGQVRGAARLRIWGRPLGQDSRALAELARALPADRGRDVEWLSEYRNQDIVGQVFDRVDAIVVPSIWVENSPLVVHEAQQARVPVITAAAGGMAEYVHHDMNGLVFEHRSPSALAAQMQRLVDDAGLAARLGGRGYVHSEDGEVPGIREHAAAIEGIYEDALRRRSTGRIHRQQGPWRITFDTNPDTCNLRCVMCEEHSLHSMLQVERKKSGRARREMPIDVVRKIVVEGVQHGLREIIPSTMGEPLLYANFTDILALCAEHRVKLNLTTNGTFPGLGARAWAECIVPVASDVKLSVNGARKETQERVMIGTEWEKVLANARTFLDVRDEHARRGGDRCRVTFQITFLEWNVGELADLVRLAIELGVDRVKGHHVWAHFEELRPLSLRRDAASITRFNAAVADARAVAHDLQLPNGERVLLENFFSLDERTGAGDLAVGGPCPFLGKEAWVSAEGRFDPCCAPDAKRRTLGEFGNVKTTSLKSIWDGAEYGHLLKSYRTRSLCIGCNMRKPVETST